ncbi:MAG: ABC transporter permease [Chloroflexi bacterium]|nr:MAG: ABC transporter permease [Chloroflexota bacterium]TMG56904.1 MAG: ABC transporter permease [Chloroflexota bacterium]
MCSRSREVRSRSRTSSSVSRDVSSVSEPSAVRTRSVSPPLRAPALTEIFRALLEADFTVQLRNNRALLLSFALPLVLLYALFASFAVKRGIIVGDPQFKVAAALTLGMASIAILGYAMTVARDREKGIFQRLRVTPAPTWTIMTSRLLVQVAANLAMALVLLVAADLFEGVSLIAEAYLLTFIGVIFSSALFLSVGQALAGLVKSADTLSAVGRIAYLPLFALGLFGQSTIFGTTFELISRWSPGGTVETLLSGAMNPSSWNSDTWLALAVSTAYSVVFAGIGIRWFQWGAR